MPQLCYRDRSVFDRHASVGNAAEEGAGVSWFIGGREPGMLRSVGAGAVVLYSHGIPRLALIWACLVFQGQCRAPWNSKDHGR